MIGSSSIKSGVNGNIGTCAGRNKRANLRRNDRFLSKTDAVGQLSR